MNNSPFKMRGVIEGFYGVYYTFPERNDLIRFIGEHNFTHYIYAPKNDRQHRNRWKEPYPPKIMGQFRETILQAQQSGVTFCYALSPVPAIRYSEQDDFSRLTDKLCDFYQIGVRSFSLLVDDITVFFHNTDEEKLFRSYGQAQAELCNRVFDWLKHMDPACTLSMCPTDYFGVAPYPPALFDLGLKLNPEIDVFYTGPQVCSSTIDVEDVHSFSLAIGRRPVIWDNYPVNDLSMQPEMHLGPFRGRSKDLLAEVNGLVANLMPQAEASKIALLTLADYFEDPQGYDPQASWEKALRQVAGEESYPSLRLFAGNSLRSCMEVEETERLEKLASSVLDDLRCGARPSALPTLQDLDAYLQDLDEACYHLRYRMDNLALRSNLLPWIERLDYWQDLGRQSLQVLLALESGTAYAQPLRKLQEALEAVRSHPKRIGGKALLPLAEFTLEQVRVVQETATCFSQ